MPTKLNSRGCSLIGKQSSEKVLFVLLGDLVKQ